MTKIKVVYCPSCHEKIFPHWNNTVGVYRGWCDCCQSIVYVRENGRPWLSRPDRKWLTVADEQFLSRSGDTRLRLHFLITETDLATIRDFLRDVWKEFVSLFDRL